jgi:hypothetical protein
MSKEETKQTTQAPTEELKKVPWITKVIFWIAFAALLATSIPHVAWVYQIFEPKDSTSINLWFTSISVTDLTSNGIAVGIDVMAAWLTYTITLGGRKGNKSLWLFIAVLVAFSWYCNYIYAMAHDPQSTQNVWTISLWFTTTGDITPVLISAVPVLVIAYTIMWEQIGKSGNVDPAKLAEQATLLEQANEHKQRIRAAKRANRQDAMKGFFADAKDFAGQAVTLVKRDKQESEDPGEETETEDTEDIVEAPANSPVSPVEAPIISEVDTDKLIVIKPSVPSQNGLNGHTETEAPTLLETLASGNGHNGHSNGHAQFIPPYRRNKA